MAFGGSLGKLFASQGFGNIGAVADLAGGFGSMISARKEAKRKKLLTKALEDPSHPMFKKMMAEEVGGSQRQFMKGIREMELANRRSALMGRREYIDPERYDERKFRGILDARRQAQDTGKENVRSRLSGMLGREMPTSRGLGATWLGSQMGSMHGAGTSNPEMGKQYGSTAQQQILPMKGERQTTNTNINRYGPGKWTSEHLYQKPMYNL